MGGAFLTAAGIVLVCVTVRDAWRTALRPAGGELARVVARTLWVAARGAGSHGRLAVAGPLAVVAVALLWVLGIGLGFSFVWAPHLGGSAADGRHLPADALVVSFLALRTGGAAGLADMTRWTRLLALAESFVGVGLLALTIGWLASTLPALARRRTLARDVHALLDAVELHRAGGLRGLRSSTLDRLSERVARAADDLAQSPVLYYFHDASERSALDTALPALSLLSRAAAARQALSFSALQLQQALGGLGAVLREEIGLAGNDLDAVLQACARDHGRSPRYVPELMALWRSTTTARPLRPAAPDTRFKSGGIQRGE